MLKYVYKYCRKGKNTENEVENRKIRYKKWFIKACNDKYKELKIISKSKSKSQKPLFED